MFILQLYTAFHTTLSFIAIISGILVIKGLIVSANRQLWTILFLVSSALTTITGFFFPFNGVTPALILGVLSIAPITLAFLARYRYRLHGVWRGTYVITSIMTLYFNCFILVVQSFQQIPSLITLAPTQSEPPIQIAQLVTLIIFIGVGFISLKKYKPKIEEELTNSYISPHIEPE